MATPGNVADAVVKENICLQGQEGKANEDFRAIVKIPGGPAKTEESQIAVGAARAVIATYMRVRLY